MKVAATLLLLVLLSAITLPVAAQPVVSYAIPDVVAPGMNIYLELVGPIGTIGNFGNDAFYMNNTGDAVRVELVNALDAPNVTVGPVVVSWEGRLISTQLFVKSARTSGAPIQLRVTVNGVSGAPVSIGIMTPQTLGVGGTLTGGGALGSGGPLGNRSTNGVMIVDQMILTSGNYTVATGNYFPMIILSKGKVEVRSGATLSEKPCSVTQRFTRTPIAPILASRPF